MTRLFFRQNFVYSMHSLCISYKTKSGTDGLWKGFHRLQTFSRTATSFQFRHITSQACSSYCDRRWWEKWYLWKIAQEANSFPFNILICLSLWTVKVGASFLGFWMPWAWSWVLVGIRSRKPNNMVLRIEIRSLEWNFQTLLHSFYFYRIGVMM